MPKVWRLEESDCALCGTPREQCVIYPAQRTKPKGPPPSWLTCARCHRSTKNLVAKQCEDLWWWFCGPDAQERCDDGLKERQAAHQREIEHRVHVGMRRGDAFLVSVQDPMSAAHQTANLYFRVRPGEDPEDVVRQKLREYHADADYLVCVAYETS